MKKSIVKDIAVFLILLVVAAILCYFLPEKVPVHFNAQGEADLAVNRWFLMLAVVIPYSVYWQFFRRNKKGEK